MDNKKIIPFAYILYSYGFAIGNVAAFDMSDPKAIVSPGMSLDKFIFVLICCRWCWL